jgi:branched-chain amino acid aminotransferase
MHATFHESVAMRWSPDSNRFDLVPRAEIAWPVDDFGAVWGTILVERFRTYGRKIVDLDDRFQRLSVGAKELQTRMPFSADEFTGHCKRLLDANQRIVDDQDDVSLVVLLSPGETSFLDPNFGSRPSCFFHLAPIPFARLSDWYTHGTPLVFGKHSNVPSTCWPNTIKTRSRLPYALSQLQSSAPGALDVLTTVQGNISDTSVANLLMVDQLGSIVSPQKNDILHGCTLRSIERLWNAIGRRIIYRDLAKNELFSAREVILTGSIGGVWHASSLEGLPIGDKTQGPVARRLCQLWSQHVGIDFEQQAIRSAK